MTQLQLRCVHLIMAVAIAGLAGCTTSLPVTTLGAVGPARGSSFAGNVPGRLCVLTATTEYNDGDTMYYPHGEYTIYRANGSRVRSVENHTSSRDENPATVSVLPGIYYVVADSESDGRVKVPVCISGGEITVVDLEGPRALGRHDVPVEAARAVRTPSGQIVGWRAGSQAKMVEE